MIHHYFANDAACRLLQVGNCTSCCIDCDNPITLQSQSAAQYPMPVASRNVTESTTYCIPASKLLFAAMSHQCPGESLFGICLAGGRLLAPKPKGMDRQIINIMITIQKTVLSNIRKGHRDIMAFKLCIPGVIANHSTIQLL